MKQLKNEISPNGKSLTQKQGGVIISLIGRTELFTPGDMSRPII